MADAPVPAEDVDFKKLIFISWSGDQAREVAIVIRKFIRSLFNLVEPWMSEEDIGPGLRGLDEIRTKLNESFFGIFIITRENENAPWINFEAGALSKVLDDNGSLVVPLLVDYDYAGELNSPLKQFQTLLLNEKKMVKVCKLIAEESGVEWERIEPNFSHQWTKAWKKIKLAKSKAHSKTIHPSISREPEIDLKIMVPEILETVRDLKRDQLSNAVALTDNEKRWIKIGKNREESEIANEAMDVAFAITESTNTVLSFSYSRGRRLIDLKIDGSVSDEKIKELKLELHGRFDAIISIDRHLSHK